jgi:hypothetical protein
MIKSALVAMNDTNAAKFENEFDTVDNQTTGTDGTSSDATAEAQAQSGAFRATDMTRKGMKVYSIETTDAGFTAFFGEMGKFVAPLMANEHNLSLNPIQNAYRVLSDDNSHAVDLAATHGSAPAQELANFFTTTPPTSMTTQVSDSSIRDKGADRKTTVYDEYAISFANNDFSADTIARLQKFCIYMDATATTINGGTVPDAATTQKILAEKVGLSWVNFYNVAQDQIERSKHTAVTLAMPEGITIDWQIRDAFGDAMSATAPSAENPATKLSVYEDDASKTFTITLPHDDLSVATSKQLEEFCAVLENALSMQDGPLDADATKAALIENKFSPEWVKFYSDAKDQIARSIEANKPVPYVSQGTDLGDGVTEFGVYSEKGVHTLPQNWFDQRLSADTKQLIMDRNDSSFSWDTTAYNEMAKDGVSLEDLNALIYSDATSAEDAASGSFFSYKYWYGKADATIKGVIDGFAKNTRVFNVSVQNVSAANATPYTLQVFIDSSTGFVGTQFVGESQPAAENSADARKDGLINLYYIIPGEQDDNPLYEYAKALSISLTRDDLLGP